MIATTPQPDLVALRSLNLNKSSIASLRIVGFCGAGQQLEIVIRRTENLADAADQMAIGRERSARKERL